MDPVPALATVVVAATGDRMWSQSKLHAPDASGDTSSTKRTLWAEVPRKPGILGPAPAERQSGIDM